MKSYVWAVLAILALLVNVLLASGRRPEDQPGRTDQMAETKTYHLSESRGAEALGSLKVTEGSKPVLELTGNTPAHQKLKAAYDELSAKQSLGLDAERHEDGKRIYDTMMVKPGDKNYPYALLEGLRHKGFVNDKF